MRSITLAHMLGQTVTEIDSSDDMVVFYLENGQIVRMYHNQDCCESVSVHSIDGDLNSLIGSKIIYVIEANDEVEDFSGTYRDSSHTWTNFYLKTKKGKVTINWLGESNGYYSESVSLYLKEPNVKA